MKVFTFLVTLCLASLLFFVVIAGNFSIYVALCSVLNILNVFIAGILAAIDFDKMQNKIKDMEAEIEILKKENKNGN